MTSTGGKINREEEKIMLLVLNTITTEEDRQRFDSLLRDEIYTGMRIETLYLTDQINDLEKYSHLLISGSSISSVEGSQWDEKIYQVIEHFVIKDKAVLGICYGHQILAKYLGGIGVIRRSKRAQFGFREIYLDENPLFNGLGRFYGMEAHLDEVYNVPSEFKIIAMDSEGVIQGYQYNDTRIWGIQFHPEYNYYNGLASWERKERKHPEWKAHFEDKVPFVEIMEQNQRIYRNFLNQQKKQKN